MSAGHERDDGNAAAEKAEHSAGKAPGAAPGAAVALAAHIHPRRGGNGGHGGGEERQQRPAKFEGFVPERRPVRRRCGPAHGEDQEPAGRLDVPVRVFRHRLQPGAQK